MKRTLRFAPAAVAVLAVAACNSTTEADVERALDPLNVIDESNLSDIMLNAAAPDEAVNYFRRAAAEDGERIDLQRGLATSLVRAGRAAESLTVWQGVVAHDAAMEQDRVDYADALIRTGDWDGAQAQLNAIPPTFETYERYRLEAMIADSEEEWDRADSFYETAAGLTTRPANVYNNWGYSHLTRGDYPGAEELFLRAISYDPELFTAKNNLVLARAAQGNYQLPLVNMTQTERAQLLHTAALAAIRQGEVDTGRGLLNEAIDTHPQHFEAAVTALRALEA
ncbi:lipopolysaccharide assembly protein LapB [Hasllibacter sp. MH4015]|uniref:tetratricopeptide repeat protein n=1 Tax=Hasllibacter sp. MH4015 TaxID=2854029 RepID=UPI001CD787BD|nr:tetratricopeptide repeat protein [Hasllibacter sp. MH4015]